MPTDREPDPHAGARTALERCWLMGRRLSQVRGRVVGTLLPTSPERLTGLGREEEERVDAFLFRLGAAVTALIEDVMEPVLLAEGRLLFLDVAEDLRELERCGAISSAETTLGIRDRVRRHHQIAALAPEVRAAALNGAWGDGQAIADLLAGLSSHIQRRGLVPGLDLQSKTALKVQTRRAASLRSGWGARHYLGLKLLLLGKGPVQ